MTCFCGSAKYSRMTEQMHLLFLCLCQMCTVQDINQNMNLMYFASEMICEMYVYLGLVWMKAGSGTTQLLVYTPICRRGFDDSRDWESHHYVRIISPRCLSHTDPNGPGGVSNEPSLTGIIIIRLNLFICMSACLDYDPHTYLYW